MTLIVLADRVPAQDVLAAAKRAAAPVDVLAFSRAGDLADEIASALGSRLGHVLPVRDVMREAVPIAREKFVRFVAEWSARQTVFGRDFRDGFRRSGCSAWWFTELLHKNAGTRPTFARLCELEALKLVLARHSYDRAIVACSDRDQASVLIQACARASVAAEVAPQPRRAAGPGFLRLFLGRVKRCALDAAATVLARVYQLPERVSLDPGRRSIAFHSWFPAQWRTWGSKLRDRCYVDIPDLIRRKTAWRSFYACLLLAPSLRTLRSNIRAATEQVRHEPDTFVFLERWASTWDVCRVYGDVRPALKYWWLETFDRRFRGSFTWDDIDIFPLARHDLRVSIVRDLPYYELLIRRVCRMVSELRPSDFVTFLETYPCGRAVAWGVHAADTTTRVIGFQHSAVNANQLMYRFMPSELPDLPMPDVFLLYGDDARQMLHRSGVADERLVVTGARRFDDLADFRRRRRDEFAELRRPWGIDDRTSVVLIATNFWADMSSALLRMCVRALADRPDTLVLVKPHPYHRAVESELPPPSGARARFVITDENLNQLQAAADVMIGAFGTADAEAVAIGCPVVHVSVGDFDLSPTSDHPGVTLEAQAPEELREAIDRLLAGDVRQERADEFIERVFYRLDGRSGERVIAALSALDAKQAAVPA